MTSAKELMEVANWKQVNPAELIRQKGKRYWVWIYLCKGPMTKADYCRKMLFFAQSSGILKPSDDIIYDLIMNKGDKIGYITNFAINFAHDDNKFMDTIESLKVTVAERWENRDAIAKNGIVKIREYIFHDINDLKKKVEGDE